MTELPLHRLPLRELSRRVHAGELSPVALTEHYLSRIDALNGALGAFCAVTRERALAEAQAAELTLRKGLSKGPLHGLPFAVKKSIGVRGLPTAHGLVASTESAPEDSEPVRRLNAAGMVLLGKTRTNDFASGGTGINTVEGTAHNPWKQEAYLPGGSSSGSAVAVAAGLVPATLGTDNGGSVRIPAALCGLVGLRPALGRVPRAGMLVLGSLTDTAGPLTRQVEDTLWLLQALSGVHAGEPFTETVAPLPKAIGLGAGVRGLRIVPAEQGDWASAHPGVRTGVQAAWRALAQQGAQVVPRVLPEFDELDALSVGSHVVDAEMISEQEAQIEAHWDRLNPVTQARIETARKVSASQHLAARTALLALRAELPSRWRDMDALVMATCLQRAVPVEEADTSSKGSPRVRAALTQNTNFGSQLDLACLTVPSGFSFEGLPTGVMVCTLPGREDVLFRIAAVLEQAFGLADRWPDLSWAGDA